MNCRMGHILVYKYQIHCMNKFFKILIIKFSIKRFIINVFKVIKIIKNQSENKNN